MDINRLRIEYVVFNKLYNIIRNKTDLPRGLLIVGPRSVGKSFVLNRLLALVLMRDLNTIKKCLFTNNNKNDNKECILVKKFIKLIDNYNIIPLSHDCKSDSNLNLEYIDKYARAFTGLTKLTNSNTKHTILLLFVDNVHFCYDSIREILDSFLARGRIIVVAASPTAYRPRELKRNEFEIIRFYPLRFGEISIELISALKDLEGKLLPLKGEERREIISDIDKLYKHINNIYSYIDENLENLYILFGLYSVFGGTIAGYNILNKIIKNDISIELICNNDYSENKKILNILFRNLRIYIDAVRRTYDAIIDDAVEIGRIDNEYKPYVEATFQALARSVFEEYNITFSGNDLINKSIEIGNNITFSVISKGKAQSIVQKTLEYLRQADILFQVKAYRSNINKNKKDNLKEIKHKYIYSDPRYLYAAYYGYLLHIPYDSIRDPSSTIIEKLMDILFSIICIENNYESSINEGLIGTLLEMITLQNIMLNLYGIRASADKPRNPQPAGYGLYTYRLESGKRGNTVVKNEDNKRGEVSGSSEGDECSQFELDALIVKNGVPLYGIEISRSKKDIYDLKCIIKFAKDNRFSTIFNIYLRSDSNKIVKKEEYNGVKIIYVPIPLFLLVTI